MAAGNGKRKARKVDNDSDLVLLWGNTVHVAMDSNGRHGGAFKTLVVVPFRTHDYGLVWKKHLL
ncbi:BREX-2 system phosphatase PglZ [Sesbania bispinosa]|nr:BREX-2 system phosphatase PglZ [Sesbania bispinosa]